MAEAAGESEPMLRLAIIIILLSAAPAYARDVAADIAERYASAHFCDRPRPKAEHGAIVVWWERDASGRCTIQRAQ